MKELSYYEQTKLRFNNTKSKYKAKHPEIADNIYPEDLVKMIVKQIEIYGHAYCMDVPAERNKISKLIYNLLVELSKKE
jgi:hypothetical protein